MGMFKKVPGWRNMNDAQLNKLKETLVEIASDYADCCDKHNLNYMMGAGTALGAVRHKGFIPWDDDMDFHMPRKDYNKFLSIATKELGDKYYFKSNAKGDKVSYPSIHMILKGTRYVNYTDLIHIVDTPDEEQGIYIDIIPYDNASDIKAIRLLKETICLSLYFVASCVDINLAVCYFKKHNIKISREDYKAIKMKRNIGRIFGVLPSWKWMRFIDRIATLNKKDNSRWVTCYVGKKINKYTHLRADLWGNNRAEFEKHMWKIANNPNKYLSKEYDENYMTPPPPDRRKIHPVFELQFFD